MKNVKKYFFLSYFCISQRSLLLNGINKRSPLPYINIYKVKNFPKYFLWWKKKPSCHYFSTPTGFRQNVGQAIGVGCFSESCLL